jgi:hypothetical protein
MRKYSKAHYLKDLRKFDGWKEKERPDDEEPLDDDSIVYLQDNFTVVRDVFDEEDYIFDDVTEGWKTFCREELGFEIPEDLRYAYEEEDEEGAAEDQKAAAATAD